jgi:hypothetical protein
MFVCCECCVLSSTGLCGELITRRKESYRLWCVVACDLETSSMRRPWPTGSFRSKNRQHLKQHQDLRGKFYFSSNQTGVLYENRTLSLFSKDRSQLS